MYECLSIDCFQLDSLGEYAIPDFGPNTLLVYVAKDQMELLDGVGQSTSEH